MYAPSGAPANIVYGYVSGGFAGFSEIRGYNSRLQITGIEATSTASTALYLNFSYPSVNNGNIATEPNNVAGASGRTENYTYDPLNRIASAYTNATAGGDCWGQLFGNNASPPTLGDDALGNLVAINTKQCSPPNLGISVNVHNQISTSGYGYDSSGNGNMTNDAVHTYTFDAENRVIAAASGAYCYVYDGDGLRVAKKTPQAGYTCGLTWGHNPVTYEMYWRDTAGDTIAETDGTGSTSNSSYNEYIFFDGQRIAQSNPNSGTVNFYFADQLGSTRMVTSSSGSPCYKADFLPYGTENTPASFTDTCSTNYKFTGYERDSETGLDYAFARYYNSRLGRFMSTDPLAGDITDPQTLNRYAYVRNNPVNFTDPSGMWLCAPDNESYCVPSSCEDLGLFCGGPRPGGSAPPLPQPPKPKLPPSTQAACPSRFTQAVSALLIASNPGLLAAETTASGVAQLTGNSAVVGIAANVSVPLWEGLGLSAGASAGIVADPFGNIGIAITTRGGGGFTGAVAPAGTAGVSITTTAAPTIFALNRSSSPQMGATLGVDGLGGSVSVSATTGAVSITAGFAGGFSTFGGTSRTKVIPLVCR